MEVNSTGNLSTDQSSATRSPLQDAQDTFATRNLSFFRNSSQLSNISERLAFPTQDLTESTLAGKLITIFTLFDILMLFVILITIAVIKDRKINIERHPVFLPFRPPKGFRLYAILIETGQSAAGGTSSKVFLRIVGKFTKTAAFTLICTSRQRKYGGRRLFGSENKDIFILSVPHYLGDIESFEIMTDKRGDSPPWFLKSIRLLSLNNQKCWRSDVGAWLRGDGKPYSIKASITGTLSTKEYFIKIFLQNHHWTSSWFRSLGSSFSCLHRALIQWTTVGLGLGLAHFLLYDERLLQNIGSRIVFTPEFSANDIAEASFAGATAGVVIGFILHRLIEFLAGGAALNRVDDKDDLCHLIGLHKLVYEEGGVLRQTVEEFDDSYPQLDNLTLKQRKAIKHIIDCKVSECSLKNLINRPVCASQHECCFSRPKVLAATPKVLTPKPKVMTPTFEPILPSSESRKELLSVQSAKEPEPIVPAQAPVEEYVPQLQPKLDPKREPIPKPARNSEQNPVRAPDSMEIQTNQDEGDCCTDSNNCPYTFDCDGCDCDCETLSCDCSYEQPCATVDQRKGDVPFASARAQSQADSDPFTTASDYCSSTRKNTTSFSIKDPGIGDNYDSLSEPESDRELITKSARTASEINLLRRPADLYFSAPRWTDDYHIWVEAPKGGQEHHVRLNRRYDFAVLPGIYSNFAEQMSAYLVQEQSAKPGDVKLPQTFLADTTAILFSLIGLAAIQFVIYQRLALSNADSLIYLYAAVFTVLLNFAFTSTLSALLQGFFATYYRRKRMRNARLKKAKDINWIE